MKNLLITVLLALPAAGYTQELPVKAADYVKAYAAQHKFSGNVLIVKKNQIVFRQSAGYASIKDRKLNDSNTAFRIGSLTKMFTSALVLHAAQEKKLSLEDPVSKFIPGFPSGDSILIRHLLSHSSGIMGSTPQNPANLREMVTGFRSSPAAFSPGTGFRYNNFNYILLSYIMEKISGRPFPALVRQQLLIPAGMKHSGMDSAKRISKNAATGYSIDPSNNQWAAVNDDDISAASGAGALYSTTGDLLLWLKFIQNGKYLDDKSYKMATSVVQGDYGLGWIIRQFNGHRMIGHTGTVRGFNAAMMYFPADSITVIYTSNFQDLDAARFEKNLYALALSMPYQLPVEKKPIIMESKVLQQYTGVYKMENGPEISIELRDTKLVAIAPGGDRITLIPEAADKFYMEGPENAVTFARREDAIFMMTVDMGGGMKLLKVK